MATKGDDGARSRGPARHRHRGRGRDRAGDCAGIPGRRGAGTRLRPRSGGARAPAGIDGRRPRRDGGGCLVGSGRGPALRGGDGPAGRARCPRQQRGDRRADRARRDARPRRLAADPGHQPRRHVPLRPLRRPGPAAGGRRIDRQPLLDRGAARLPAAQPVRHGQMGRDRLHPHPGHGTGSGRNPRERDLPGQRARRPHRPRDRRRPPPRACPRTRSGRAGSGRSRSGPSSTPRMWPRSSSSSHPAQVRRSPGRRSPWTDTRRA